VEEVDEGKKQTEENQDTKQDESTLKSTEKNKIIFFFVLHLLHTEWRKTFVWSWMISREGSDCNAFIADQIYCCQGNHMTDTRVCRQNSHLFLFR
jgi:hypothetical protein